VLGFEADIQGSGERGSNTFADPIAGTLCIQIPAPNTCTKLFPFNFAAVTSYEAKIGWFGTVRGRLGVLITDQVLLYGTGGLAYGRVELSGVTNSYFLPAGWTWKAEYLYVDLGSLDTAAPFPPALVPLTITPLTGPLTTHTHFTDNIVRVGLNYKFGNYYAPVVTK
jgi:outer membrane immunogenic protein